MLSGKTTSSLCPNTRVNLISERPWVALLGTIISGYDARRDLTLLLQSQLSGLFQITASARHARFSACGRAAA
jgi:hypothetical protein